MTATARDHYEERIHGSADHDNLSRFKSHGVSKSIYPETLDGRTRSMRKP